MQLKYQAYIADVTFSAVTSCFYGEVINMNNNHKRQDAVVFLTSTKATLQEVLQQTVEQYLKKQREIIIS